MSRPRSVDRGRWLRIAHGRAVPVPRGSVTAGRWPYARWPLRCDWSGRSRCTSLPCAAGAGGRPAAWRLGYPRYSRRRRRCARSSAGPGRRGIALTASSAGAGGRRRRPVMPTSRGRQSGRSSSSTRPRRAPPSGATVRAHRWGRPDAVQRVDHRSGVRGSSDPDQRRSQVRQRLRPEAEGTGHPHLDPAHRVRGASAGEGARRSRRTPRWCVNRGWYPTRSINREVSSTRPAVSNFTWPGEKPPRRAVRMALRHTAQGERRNRTAGAGRPGGWPARASARRRPATFTVPEKSPRARCSITPTASDSCTNWSRASRPSTIGTNGDSAK